MKEETDPNHCWYTLDSCVAVCEINSRHFGDVGFTLAMVFTERKWFCIESLEINGVAM